MPLGFVDDLEGGIADKEVGDGSLGDKLSADEDGANILFSMW